MGRSTRMLGGIAARLALVCATGVAASPELSVRLAEPDEAFTELFANRDGWLGADAIYSIPLPDDSVLWAFGDTLTGTIRNGRRSGMRMVNNSFARQRGTGSAARVQFYLPRGDDGEPASTLVPPGKEGYYWPWDGVVEQGRLLLFVTRVASSGEIAAFGWQLVDQSLAEVENPQDDPAGWKWRELPFPYGRFAEGDEALWGLEILRHEDWLYVYGTVRRRPGGPRGLVAARAPAGALTHFSRWQFLGANGWQDDPRQVLELTEGVGTEGSITWLPRFGKYAYVYSPPLDPRILYRTARSPVGPWSEPATMYVCPETGWNPRVFCYAAKARPIPEADDGLLVSYATNSFDMRNDALADARIYFPRFVRVRVGEVASREEAVPHGAP